MDKSWSNFDLKPSVIYQVQFKLYSLFTKYYFCYVFTKLVLNDCYFKLCTYFPWIISRISTISVYIHNLNFYIKRIKSSVVLLSNCLFIYSVQLFSELAAIIKVILVKNSLSSKKIIRINFDLKPKVNALFQNPINTYIIFNVLRS